MATVHGILIKDGKLEAVDLKDDLEVYYATLGCDTIDITMREIGGFNYDIVCDDEGLYNKDAPISMMSREDQTPMLVGSLFICRHNREGNLTSLNEDDAARIKAWWKYRVLWGRYC